MIKKLAIGISGASGVNLGVSFIKHIPQDIELFVIISNGAKKVAQYELNINLEQALKESNKNFSLYDESQMDSPLSSGSFGISSMAIIPTSMNMLSKIANGLSDELISRTALVMLKEGRKLLLAPREMPLSHIHLKQMAKLAKLGVAIAPPIVGYYGGINNLEKMEHFFIGKWLDCLGIENDLYKRWGS